MLQDYSKVLLQVGCVPKEKLWQGKQLKLDQIKYSSSGASNNNLIFTICSDVVEFTGIGVICSTKYLLQQNPSKIIVHILICKAKIPIYLWVSDPLPLYCLPRFNFMKLCRKNVICSLSTCFEVTDHHHLSVRHRGYNEA